MSRKLKVSLDDSTNIDDEEDNIEPYMDLSLSDAESDDNDNDEESSDDESDELNKVTDWGKKKKAYHKYSEDSEDEDEDEDDMYDENLDEEAEVIRIQQMKSSKKTEEDYDDTFGYVSRTKDLKKSLINSKDRSIIQSIHEDLEELTKEKKESFKSLSKEQKRSFLNKEYPKFMLLIEEFKRYSNELKTKLHPLLEKSSSEESTLSANAKSYIRRRYQTLLKFCTTSCFYFLLIAEGKTTQRHPILDHLEEIQTSIDEYAPIEKRYRDQFREILKSSSPKAKLPSKNVSETNSKKRKKVSFDEDLNDTESDLDYYRSVESATKQKKLKLKEEKDLLENFYEYRELKEAKGKRGITREILKNTGLRRKRKKEDRNPRVKNKNKYAKALKRRKGQVQPMRDQSKPYSGEATGINKSIVKAVRLG